MRGRLYRLWPDGHFVAVVTLAALPFLLLAINDSWTYTVPTLDRSIDPYIYTGYFQDLRGYLAAYGPLYYSSRLPWLLLGNAVHSMASFELANLTLRFLLLYGAAFSLYVIVFVTWRNSLAALTAALLLATHTYFLQSISWDYVDGPGAVCMLAALASATVAVRSRYWFAWLAASGAFIMLAVSVQIFLLALAPATVPWYLVLNWRALRHRLDVSLACIIAGAAAVYLVFGAINQHIAGWFNYLEPQYTFASDLNDKQWQRSLSSWIGDAGWLVFPVIGACLATLLVSLAVRRAVQKKLQDEDVAAALAGLIMLGTVGVFVVIQLSGFMSVLQYSMYASFLTPFVFIVLGAALARAYSNLTYRGTTYLLTAAGVTAVVLAPFGIGLLRFLPNCPDSCLSSGPAVAMLAVTIAVLATAVLLRSGRIVLVGLVALSLLNVAVADSSALPIPSQQLQKDRSLMVEDADRLVRAYERGLQAQFWYDDKEPLFLVYRAVAARHLWGYRLVGEEFPQRRAAGPMTAGLNVIYMTSETNALERLNAAVAGALIKIDVVSRGTVRRGRESLEVVVFKTKPKGRAHDLALSDFKLANGKIKLISAGLSVRTLERSWSYVAVLPLPQAAPLEPDAPAQVILRVRVKEGTVGFGVDNSDLSVAIDRKPVSAGTGTTEVFLTIPVLRDAGYVIVQTWDRGAGAAVIESVQLLQ